MCDFKIGDYVACKIDKYGITTKGRPCLVREVRGNEIIVFCFGDGDCYNVSQKEFTLLENFKPLNIRKKLYLKAEYMNLTFMGGSGYILADGSKRYTIPYSELHKLHKVGGMLI